MLFIIQEGIHCMPTTDYFFTSIQPEPIIVSSHIGNHSEPTVQQAATKDQVSQQTHPLQLGETRVYPPMLADKQVPALNLTESTIASQADLQTAFQSIHLCSTKDDELLHGREESKEDEDTELLSTRQRVFRRRNKSAFTYISCGKCTIPVPVIVLYLCHTLVSSFTTNLNSTELHLQGVAPRSQYSDPTLEAVTLQ